MKLGERIGDGHFGDVYTMEGLPTQVLKMIHQLEGGAQSVAREANGAGLLKGLVRSPGIRGLRNGGDTGLSYIIKDKMPNIEVPSHFTPELEPFVGRVYSTFANNGRVWLDGHLNNMYVIRNAAGKVVDIGIHDTDMINMSNDPAVAGELGRIVRLFQREASGQTPPMARLFNYSNLAKEGTLDAQLHARSVRAAVRREGAVLMRKLTIPERRQLHTALLAAFPDWNTLATALDLFLGENLNQISAPAAMPTVVMNLIVWGEARGRLAQVIEAARDANPTNPELAAFAQAVIAATPATSLANPEVARQIESVVRAQDGTAPPAAPAATGAAKDALERIVLQTVAFFGPDEWRARMRTRERAVCRVEFPAAPGRAPDFSWVRMPS